MFNLILYAIPFFTLFLVVEALSLRGAAGYDTKDAATSIAMGSGNVVVTLGWKLAVLAIYAAAYDVAPFHLPSRSPWTWLALFVIDDAVYYW